MFALAAFAALALVCLPLVASGQRPDVGDAVATAIEAGRRHDWQVALAAALGLVAWALRRFAEPSHVFRTRAGAVGITIACTTIGALVPVLQAHAFTLAALVGAITSGLTAALALSNPNGSGPGAGPPAVLLLVAGLGLASMVAGCSDPIRQGATATLRAATAAVQTFEQWDHQHKRDLAAAVVKACSPAPVGAERDACVDREMAPLRDYLAARKPVIDVLDGMEVSAGVLQAVVDLDGPAPPELATIAQTVGDAVAKAIALVEKLRSSPDGGVK
jgi:hypothetical protein